MSLKAHYITAVGRGVCGEEIGLTTQDTDPARVVSVERPAGEQGARDLGSQSRETGCEAIGAVPWGSHFCLFYQTKEDLLDILVPYFKAGLEAGEFCMWVTSHPLQSDEARQALARAVAGFEGYVARGQIEILDYSQWYTLGGSFNSDRVLAGWVEKEHLALRRGFAGLRLSGNTFWLESTDWQEFFDYEAAVDQVLGQYRMLALCTYSLEKCGVPEVLDVVANHQFALVKRAGRWETIASAERKRAVEALRLEQARSVGMMESLLDPVLLFDASGACLHANPAAVDAYGFDPAEAFEGPEGRAAMARALSICTADGHPLDPEHFPTSRALRGQKVMGERYSMLDKQGTDKFILVSASPLLADGVITGAVATWHDVTEQERLLAEVRAQAQALREARDDLEQRVEQRTAELEAIFASLPDAAYMGDGDGIRRCNRAALEILGCDSIQDLWDKVPNLAEKIQNRYVDTDLRIPTAEEPFVRALQGEPAVLEMVQRNLKTGQDVIVRSACAPIVTNGEVVGAVAINTDITEQKRIQTVLAEQEQDSRRASLYARNLIEASLDPLVTISPEGKITDVNEATELATGVSRRQLIDSDFSNYFTEPDRARAGYQQVLAQGLVRDYPLTIRHASGGAADVLYNASLYRDEAGDVKGVFAAARDITERKRAEEESHRASLYARSLIEASLDPLVTISPEGKITDVNRATEAVTGIERGRLIGTDFSDYFTEPERARQGYRQVLEKGLVRDYPLTIRHVGGQTTDVLYNATVYRDEGGEIEGVFAAAHDITERRRAEEERAQRIRAQAARAEAEAGRERLEAANKELEAFAYSISHDLRSPLRGIDGFANILLTEYCDQLDPEAQHYLGLVRGNADRMGELIDDLLAFSRLGRQSLQKQPVVVARVVRQALDELQAQQEARQVEIVLGELPRCQADPVLLRQVFVNLLSNAFKFSRKRAAPRIEIRGWQEGQESVYCVSDNGVGFDMKYVDKLFGVFQRLHSTEEYEGTGAGLAIVQRIIIRHGGRVWAEGRLDGGAAFYFALDGVKA